MNMRWWPWRRRLPGLDTFALGMLTLRPGDTLVLRTQEALPLTAIKSIRDSLRREFPDHKVLVLTSGWELSILRSTDAAVAMGPGGPITQATLDEWRAAWVAQHEGRAESSTAAVLDAVLGPVRPGLTDQTLG